MEKMGEEVEERECGRGKGEVSGRWADWPQGTSLHNPQTSYDRAWKVVYTHTHTHTHTHLDTHLQYMHLLPVKKVLHMHCRSLTHMLTHIQQPPALNTSCFIAH